MKRQKIVIDDTKQLWKLINDNLCKQKKLNETKKSKER